MRSTRRDGVSSSSSVRAKENLHGGMTAHVRQPWRCMFLAALSSGSCSQHFVSSCWRPKVVLRIQQPTDVAPPHRMIRSFIVSHDPVLHGKYLRLHGYLSFDYEVHSWLNEADDGGFRLHCPFFVPVKSNVFAHHMSRQVLFS